MNREKGKSFVLAALGVIVLTALDQLTKMWAMWALNPEKGGSDIVLWDGVFRLHYLENRGAAFGILQGNTALLALTTVLVFAVIAWIYGRMPREKKFRYLRWIAVFLMAGAIGNFIDRIRLKYVVDFFYFELIDFPVFNVADIYVTCSVVVFVLLFIFYYKEADMEQIWPSRKKKEAS